jgi:uncharacterized membrane protein SirB2
MKGKVVLWLTRGVVFLLIIIVVGDFYIALQEMRPVDESIIHLLQTAIVGVVGIIGTYFGMNHNDDE